MEVQMNDIFKEIKSMEAAMVEIRRKYKTLLRDFKKEHKQYLRLSKREEKKNSKKKTHTVKSGIHQECNVSDDLCVFMGIAPGTKVARTNATVFINRYIKKKSLQRMEDKKRFRIDTTLSRLFNIPENDSLSYFEIPRKMNQHFLKKSS